MNKREVISSILYNLNFDRTVYFEVDEIEDFAVFKNENLYQIEGGRKTIQVANKTELRVAIAKLGKTIVEM